ncbi:hypothetical protein [Litorilituus sediminis]|uniref:hypothetical protein n=1 Tax=Litorilituus sediminis TaxID=718192 RepID=UPI001476D796|nr:hypothetical protein [Litorilituus sediminis]
MRISLPAKPREHVLRVAKAKSISATQAVIWMITQYCNSQLKEELNDEKKSTT